VGISDIRGIESGLELKFDEQQLAFEAGTGFDWMRAGVHVPLPQLDGQQARAFDYGFDIALQGTGQLHVLPVGRSSSVAMRANWPHPSFIGSYLPTAATSTTPASAPTGRPRSLPPTWKTLCASASARRQCNDFLGAPLA
jgi:inner membrane protein